MGRVWRAYDEVLDREVAVKELVASTAVPVVDWRGMRLRAVREARAAAQLDHPAIVRIFDVVQTASRSWIVMEYVRSRSLQEVLVQDGPLTHREAARVGLAVLSGLRAAHAAGVLHLDVKPHNVLLAAGGRVVLTDFGLATLGVAREHRSTVKQHEPLLGSPHYIAPERLRGEAADPRADLWSLGATLHTAVEGCPPFDRSSTAEALSAVLADDPDPPQRAGPLSPVIAGLLARDLGMRAGAAETQAALWAITRRAIGVVTIPAPRRPTDDAVPFRSVGVPVKASPAVPPRLETGRRRPVVATAARRSSARWGLVAAGVAMAAAAVGWVAVSGPDREPVASEPSPAMASTGAAPCPAAVSRPVASWAPAPYALPAGWLWHVDPAGFALPIPRGWARADADAGALVCFTGPDAVRTITVAAGPPTTADPLRHWQVTEERALAAGTLPGYRKVSMGVLLVSGGGADWEYSWQPATGPRLHTRRVLLSDAGIRSYRLTWTTRDEDWDLDLGHQRTALDGLRDPAGRPSPWAVPAPTS
ncbi:hypothetical protein GCM10025331_77840 [Actinoplanes utahensis]|nr:serine/threonine protein kinase [Actinoplanes utahensis]